MSFTSINEPRLPFEKGWAVGLKEYSASLLQYLKILLLNGCALALFYLALRFPQSFAVLSSLLLGVGIMLWVWMKFPKLSQVKLIADRLLVNAVFHRAEVRLAEMEAMMARAEALKQLATSMELLKHLENVDSSARAELVASLERAMLSAERIQIQEDAAKIAKRTITTETP